MKKNYITPNINVVQFEALCSGGLVKASVYRESIKEEEFITSFQVVDEKTTKTEYQGLWGESNSDKWGDD